MTWLTEEDAIRYCMIPKPVPPPLVINAIPIESVSHPNKKLHFDGPFE